MRDKVVLLTPEIVPFPNYPASISQDRVDLIVQMDDIGDPSLIGVGAARATRNPRELLIARRAADVIEHSGYFKDGFSMQTGSGAASTAATRFLEERMSAQEVTASFALGGITGAIADLHEKGLVKTVVDVQSFDSDAAKSLRTSQAHLEISANEYANATSKGAYVDRVDVVILSAPGNRSRFQCERDHRIRRRHPWRVGRALRRRRRRQSRHRGRTSGARPNSDRGAPRGHRGYARRIRGCFGDRPRNRRKPEASGSRAAAARCSFAGDDHPGTAPASRGPDGRA